jgi:hypothetical protein
MINVVCEPLLVVKQKNFIISKVEHVFERNKQYLEIKLTQKSDLFLVKRTVKNVLLPSLKFSEYETHCLTRESLTVLQAYSS